jgi:primosomal protein N'
LPPFTRLIRVEIDDAEDAKARFQAEMVARLLRRACASMAVGASSRWRPVPGFLLAIPRRN